MKNTYEMVSTLTPKIIELRIKKSAARIDRAMDDMSERKCARHEDGANRLSDLPEDEWPIVPTLKLPGNAITSYHLEQYHQQGDTTNCVVGTLGQISIRATTPTCYVATIETMDRYAETVEALARKYRDDVVTKNATHTASQIDAVKRLAGLCGEMPGAE
jgi:hypothetical protein